MRRRRRRLSRTARRQLRFALLGLAALLLLAGVAIGLRLFQAARHLRAAEGRIDEAIELIEQGRIADASAALDDATGRLSGATGALHGRVEIDVLRPLPIVGGNLRELREAVALAAELTTGGSRILAAAEPLQGPDGTIEVPLRSGSLPLEAIRAVQVEAETLARSLPDESDLHEDPGYLFPPVRDARDRIVEEVDRRRSQLSNLANGLAVADHLAGGQGDRFYLIAIANTAEMRGSGGMVLNYGGLLGQGGDFRLTEFGRIDDLFLTEPVEAEFVADVPDDYLRRWDGFEPLRLWRNATMAADFTVVAPVLEAMFGAARGVAVDGVIQIDPEGLAAILAGIGPVTVDELGEVDSENLVPLVLHEAYVRYTGIEERSDVLEEVAEAAFERLVTGQYESLRPLGEALVEAVAGRHIQVHSGDVATQVRLAVLGADGALPPVPGTEAVHLTVQNVSANKLDWFVDTELGLVGDARPGAPRRVRAEVVVTNNAPPGASDPRYIYGPFNQDQEVGLYRGVVSLYLPLGTTLLGSSGDEPRDPPVFQMENGRPVVGYTVDLPAGSSHRVVLDLQLPNRRDRPYELLAVPSPRVRPTVLRTDLDTGRGRLVTEVQLDRTWRLAAGQEPEEATPPVYEPRNDAND